MTSPIITIGLPVYNGSYFLRTALDDLLAQSFPDFNLIISDNASTDSTEAICREYAEKDNRIQYIRQPVNLGAKANFVPCLCSKDGQVFHVGCLR